MNAYCKKALLALLDDSFRHREPGYTPQMIVQHASAGSFSRDGILNLAVS